jgi:hypothetical protein
MVYVVQKGQPEVIAIASEGESAAGRKSTVERYDSMGFPEQPLFDAISGGNDEVNLQA